MKTSKIISFIPALAFALIASCTNLPLESIADILKDGKINPSGTPASGQNTDIVSSGLDTARDVTYLNDLEKDVILELNKVRTNPAQYARTQVGKIKGYYKGNIIEYPDQTAIQTEEGINAVNECIEVLLASSPVPALSPSKGLSRAAQDLVNDQSGTTNTGHTGSDGSSPFDRMDRYGKWQSAAAENIDYGYNKAEYIVLSLLIDDGVSDRGHRKNILNAKFKVLGVDSGTHQQYRFMFVMDFAGGFNENN